MNEKSSCPVLRGRDSGNTVLLLDDFHTASLSFTIFAWVDLCAVEGLDTVIHEGPSTVNINTVNLPEGKTRTLFLRGAGFPDTFIDYYDSLFTTAIQYASCFISYAHQDEALAKRLYKNLQDKGVRCWFAPHDMRIGDKIRARIDEAIHLHEKLLLLLSEHAIASAWVEDEVEAAMEKENQQRREVLFPVRLDDAVMHTSQAWAAKCKSQASAGGICITLWATAGPEISSPRLFAHPDTYADSARRSLGFTSTSYISTFLPF